MSNYKDTKTCVLKLIKYYNLNIKSEEKTKIIKRLCYYSDLLIFNIVSIISLIILSNGNKRATKDMVLYLQNYIDDRCCIDKKIVINMNEKCSPKKMNGGNISMPLAFFTGTEQNQYSTSNIGNNIANANLAEGIIRPLIGGGNKGFLGGFMLGGCDSVTNCKNMNKIINKKITNIFKFYKIVSNKEVKDLLVKYFFIYINQLFVHIVKKTKGVLTVSKLNMILEKTNIMKK